MKVLFKFSRYLEGKDYAPGVHEVSDDLKNHWYFQGLLSSGSIKLMESEVPKLEEGESSPLPLLSAEKKKEPKKKSPKKGS